MRMLAAVALALGSVSSATLAGEIEDTYRQALQGRNSYWDCLAREYTQDRLKTMSSQDFTANIAGACPSERQNFRVTLLDYFSMRSTDADANLDAANRAIELAQKDIVTAFVRRKAAPN